ncbi:MAG: AIPR family protein [Nitrospira sp.]|nr:AIPR family protein [Nitrospira sp.]
MKSTRLKAGVLTLHIEIKDLREIKDRVYKNGMYLDSSPSLDLFYVTVGEWVDPEHIKGLITQDINYLKAQNIFSNEVRFQCIDANRLKQMYRELKGRSLKEVEFPAIVPLPEIKGVRQSFVGSLAVSEYIKLITDSDGNLEKSLFYDNVRDFQGSTAVNREIDKTLKSEDEQSAIAIYNNGITIIAKKIDRLGGKVKLNDFQIVNGCQTSNVLYNNKEIIQSNSHLIVKIIEIANPDIASNIIKATNRQTEVKIEAFESLSPFHKDLEDFYSAKITSRKNPIYYERRSKQYDGHPTIKKNQVITLSAQVKSFVAAFLWQPQSTHRYFGELLESNRERMFKQGDSFEKYYYSAAILNRLEILFRREFLPKDYKKFKYHMVAAIYNLFTKTATYKNSIEFEKVGKSIDDDTAILKVVVATGRSIDSAIKKFKLPSRDAVRSKQVTEFLQDELNIR